MVRQHQIEIFTAQGQDLVSATKGAEVRANEWLAEQKERVGLEIVSITLYFPPGDRNCASVLVHYSFPA